jgi:hypothetical protein
MSTNRTRIRRCTKRRITPEAIAAWQACDFHALHCALGLRVWEASPLPTEITSLGVDADYVLPPNASPWEQTRVQAAKLQRELLKAAGWPDCREAYEENLREAKHWAAYCADLLEHPERGGLGTGCDPASRRRALREARRKVAYRRRLLVELDA